MMEGWVLAASVSVIPLSHRRGSNVSLVLDMSVLGSVEPLSSTGATPRERVAQEYLQAASRTLSRQQLRGAVLNTQNLHAEFVVRKHHPGQMAILFVYQIEPLCCLTVC